MTAYPVFDCFQTFQYNVHDSGTETALRQLARNAYDEMSGGPTTEEEEMFLDHCRREGEAGRIPFPQPLVDLARNYHGNTANRVPYTIRNDPTNIAYYSTYTNPKSKVSSYI